MRYETKENRFLENQQILIWEPFFLTWPKFAAQRQFVISLTRVVQAQTTPEVLSFQFTSIVSEIPGDKSASFWPGKHFTSFVRCYSS